MGSNTLKPEDGWQHRADELAERTVLSPRQADVQALTEIGASRQFIANELGISMNTVDEHRQAIKRRVQEAEATIEEIQ